MDCTAQQSRNEFEGAAAAGPAEDDHIVYRGRVISVGDRVITSTYSGKYGGHTEVHGIPEIWIATPAGRELRFCDETLRECRIGHELVLLGDRRANRILAMRNVSTGSVVYSPKLTGVEPLGAVFTACLILFFCCVGWIMSRMFFGWPGSHDSFLAGVGRNAVFFGAIWLGWWLPRRMRMRYNLKAESDRQQIRTLLGCAN